ncbi:hypothetical protein MASR1M31_02380 [Porphyromonadaceae bacterium]
MNLSLSSLDWVIGLIVIIGSLSFGLWMAYRKQAGESSSNFFLGGRSIKWPVVGASIFATNIGAEHLVWAFRATRIAMGWLPDRLS